MFKYDIIAHEIFIKAINFMNDKQTIIAELQEANQSQNIPIIDITSLKRKARDITTTYQSIIIFTSDS